MKIGTKTLLFGVHQFLLHPLLVLVAWRLCYGLWPSRREVLATAFHDLGYWGALEMDGPTGSLHPERSERLVCRVFGEEDTSSRELVLLHSRTTAERHGRSVSRLCLPDKLSILLYPTWLYVLLARFSGEIHEYRTAAGLSLSSDAAVLRFFQVKAYRWALATSDRATRARIVRAFGRAADSAAVDRLASRYPSSF